jgi:hypothetical protein
MWRLGRKAKRAAIVPFEVVLPAGPTQRDPINRSSQRDFEKGSELTRKRLFVLRDEAVKQRRGWRKESAGQRSLSVHTALFR